MPDPDPDPDAARQTNPRYDNWPVERYDAYADWPVERATPREEGGTLEEVAEEYQAEHDDDDVEWIGFVDTGTQGMTPYLLGAGGSIIYEGEIDEAEERIVLREEGAREVESEDSIADHIEEIGEEHGWTWLSSFARTHLQDDEDTPTGADEGLELRDSEFMQHNLPASSTAEMAFTGSHTLADASGQVYVIERDFTVTSLEGDRATVDVDEEYVVTEGAEEDRRAGDAEIVDERQYRFERELDPDVDREVAAEKYLQEWHSRHVGWPPSEETGS